MKEIKIVGRYGEAKIFAVDDEKIAVDEYAKAQIKMLCDNEVSKNAKIRVMPDVHPAKVSTVGLTMTIGEKILRKGAISAKSGEFVIISVNMRDGVIFGRGKGNLEWNKSAPHGAGRILKRTEVKNQHTLSEFKMAMKEIYSTSITKDTLDESPFAYRKIADILPAIAESVEVEKILADMAIALEKDALDKYFQGDMSGFLDLWSKKILHILMLIVLFEQILMKKLKNF